MKTDVKDIKPASPIATLEKRDYSEEELSKPINLSLAAALVGMSESFVVRVLGKKRSDGFDVRDILVLLEQDAYSETFVPRSKIPAYLLERHRDQPAERVDLGSKHQLIRGNAKALISTLPPESIQCVVTSTPYWGTRLYNHHFEVEWADGEVCPFGHEQTPEGFIRHTTELLYLLKPALKNDGSVWWNLMDTYNTRTQIRANAAETLTAMKGKDSRGWKDYACRRYSAGHSYLEDGEQCLIPARVAERASRIGYLVKSSIIWKKDGSMPETVATRVTREAEFVLHLALQRAPYFDKGAYRRLPKELGGRNAGYEADKVTDVWFMPTASGTDGHGAQFPVSLPARCIALSTREDDLVLDPFIGSGTTSIAAHRLNRRSIGFDVSKEYLDFALERLSAEAEPKKRAHQQVLAL